MLAERRRPEVEITLMQEIIDEVADKAGIERPKAETIVGLILGFIKREAPQGAVSKVFAAFPDADALAAKAASQPASGGLLGSLVGGIGSALGGKAGDAATLISQVLAVGVTVAQAETAGQVVFKAVRDEAGPKVVADILKSVPALEKLAPKAA
jgi:hypothetical protein